MKDMRGLGLIVAVLGFFSFSQGAYFSGFGLIILGLFFFFYDIISYQIKLKIWHKENDRNNGGRNRHKPGGNKPTKPRNRF